MLRRGVEKEGAGPAKQSQPFSKMG